MAKRLDRKGRLRKIQAEIQKGYDLAGFQAERDYWETAYRLLKENETAYQDRLALMRQAMVNQLGGLSK